MSKNNSQCNKCGSENLKRGIRINPKTGFLHHKIICEDCGNELQRSWIDLKGV